MWHFYPSLSIPWYKQIKIQVALLRNRMLTLAAQCAQVYLDLPPSCSLPSVRGACMALVLLSHTWGYCFNSFLIDYLLFNPFSFEQSAWGMKVSPIPLPISIYRSISSHQQGCCNSSVSHHKHFTGSRKLGTATEQSPSVVFHFLGSISSDTAGQMLPRTSLSEQAGFTPQHRFHTDSFSGNLSSLDFLLRIVSVHHLKKCITFQDEVSWNRSIDHS